MAEFDEAGSVVETGSVALGLAEVVALCWSEGLAPSLASPPHAAVVRSAATTPAPRTYLLRLPEPLRLPETATFTEVPLVQRTKSEWMDASLSVKVGPDFGEGGELMTARARAAACPAAPSVIQLIR